MFKGTLMPIAAIIFALTLINIIIYFYLIKSVLH
ncbi:MAG: hypothetical protein PWK00_04080 [Coxiella burnetii]|nr:hypothetical protein [Coxiella burnetii]